MILTKTRGKINKFVFNVALKSNLFAVHKAIIKSKIMKVIFVMGKYKIFKLSQKFLSKMLELTKKYKINIVPVILRKIFPPTKYEISIISCPGNFLNSLYIRKAKNVAIILTYIKLIIVADFVETKSCLGRDEIVCVTTIIKTTIIASKVPILYFDIKIILSLISIRYNLFQLINI